MFSITPGLAIWCSEAVTPAGVLIVAWRKDRRAQVYLTWSLGLLVSAVFSGSNY
ncbi:hypothetical protein AB4Z52_07990 [Rhizobium sp. 2YAF20]|uniref:hypothetical protein n=1 Tax=Rhizobium sp. 2YAF20 TaxID=3233027 RepID=UPI003F981389